MLLIKNQQVTELKIFENITEILFFHWLLSTFVFLSWLFSLPFVTFVEKLVSWLNANKQVNRHLKLKGQNKPNTVIDYWLYMCVCLYMKCLKNENYFSIFREKNLKLEIFNVVTHMLSFHGEHCSKLLVCTWSPKQECMLSVTKYIPLVDPLLSNKKVKILWLYRKY